MKNILLKILFVLFLLLVYFSKDFFYEKIYLNFPKYYESSTKYYDEYSKDYLYNYESSKVLYRDIYDFQKEISIYKGSNEDIPRGSAVMDKNALIGIVSGVYKSSSKVMLLTNKNTVVSIKIGKAYGILKHIDNNVVITNLTGTEFNVGDKIYTSGYSKLYEGLLIGIVTKKNKNYLENTYDVKLLGDFNDLNYLTVVRDLK